MNKQNAIRALLAEYKKAIIELQEVIEYLNDEDLLFIFDTDAINPDCKSMQTILSHIVSAGYSYCIYIQNHRNINSARPERVFHQSANAYMQDLAAVIKFTEDTFTTISDDELEEFEEAKKIHTRWGQSYDIEQLMEHAIVHILRHRRQIEKVKLILKN
jgi:uncharacterized damage-inducible protein DinB